MKAACPGPERTVQTLLPTPEGLARYAGIPIAFVVQTRFVIGPGYDSPLVEEPIAEPYLKDYDAILGEHPSDWAERFDLSRWHFLVVDEGTETIGGAALAAEASDLQVGILYDIRVRPEYRGQGVGHLLFDTVCRVAYQRGYQTLEIETQNINVPACRFYERQGCQRKAVHVGAYSCLPDEIEIIWCKSLPPSS